MTSTVSDVAFWSCDKLATRAKYVHVLLDAELLEETNSGCSSQETPAGKQAAIAQAVMNWPLHTIVPGNKRGYCQTNKLHQYYTSRAVGVSDYKSNVVVTKQ